MKRVFLFSILIVGLIAAWGMAQAMDKKEEKGIYTEKNACKDIQSVISKTQINAINRSKIHEEAQTITKKIAESTPQDHIQSIFSYATHALSSDLITCHFVPTSLSEDSRRFLFCIAENLYQQYPDIVAPHEPFVINEKLTSVAASYGYNNLNNFSSPKVLIGRGLPFISALVTSKLTQWNKSKLYHVPVFLACWLGNYFTLGNKNYITTIHLDPSDQVTYRVNALQATFQAYLLGFIGTEATKGLIKIAPPTIKNKFTILKNYVCSKIKRTKA